MDVTFHRKYGLPFAISIQREAARVPVDCVLGVYSLVHQRRAVSLSPKATASNSRHSENTPGPGMGCHFFKHGFGFSTLDKGLSEPMEHILERMRGFIVNLTI
jgi:hypothetical protein